MDEETNISDGNSKEPNNNIVFCWISFLFSAEM